MYWNANGILKSRGELLHFLAHHHIDVAFLCETHLRATDAFRAPNFRVYRSDRADGYGGTAILIKNFIPHTRTPRKDLCSLEETTVMVHTAEGDFYLSSVYKSPSIRLRPTDIKKLMYSGGRPSLAVGDLNAKHTAWNSRMCTPAGNVLHSLSQRSNTLRIIGPDEPTRIDPTRLRRDDVLDIMLVDNWNGDSPVLVVHNELPSDHLPVTSDIHITTRHTNIYKHKKQYNWTKFKTLMTNIHNEHITLNTTEDIDFHVTKLTKDINDSLEHSQKPNPHTPKIYTIPDEIKRLMTTRNIQRRQYQRTRDPTDKYLLNKINEVIRNLIRDHRRDAWDKLVQNAQENNIWMLPRMLTKRRAPSQH